MANGNTGTKNGMGGSNCGKGRTMKTADMKRYGKKARRADAKKACKE